jgi:hypothetical protein
MEPIENYLSLYDPNQHRKISSMDFTIPPDFLHVIKAMHPELNLIEIHSVETYSMVDAKTFITHEYFRVNLNIQIANGSYPIGAMTQYSDSITNLFRYTYNEYKFISFQIHEMKQEPAVSNRDKFMELFGAHES